MISEYAIVPVSVNTGFRHCRWNAFSVVWCPCQFCVLVTPFFSVLSIIRYVINL